MIVMFLVATFLGVVSPFAVGTTDAGGALSSGCSRSSRNDPNQQHQRCYRHSHSHRRPSPLMLVSNIASTVSRSKKITPSSQSMMTSAPSSSSHTANDDDHDAVAVQPPPVKKKNNSLLLRRLVRNLNPLGGKYDGRWKAGETKATLLARLIFSYVSPLLDLASERTLDAHDSFQVAESRRMNQTVSKLADIYQDEQKHKAVNNRRLIDTEDGQTTRRLGQTTTMMSTTTTTTTNTSAKPYSQSLLLVRALLKHQKRMIAVTGLLRLANTVVQAFPAMLVSRLLKLVEAGEAFPPSKAALTAVSLLLVLTLKMICENQLFHFIVTMSTQTRGALEGMIFDKSLRLPGGGSGVFSKQDGTVGEKKKALGSGGVLNLMQSDASIIENAAMQIHTIWDGPLQVSF